MKQLKQLGALCVGAVALALSTQTLAESIKLKEFYSVEIQHLNAKLDNADHDLTVNLKWSFKVNPTPSDYVDSNLMIGETKKFLTEYPNKTDFFEVVNHNLAKHLIEKFKTVKAINIKISVPATKMDPFDHYTLVKASR